MRYEIIAQVLLFFPKGSLAFRQLRGEVKL